MRLTAEASQLLQINKGVAVAVADTLGRLASTQPPEQPSSPTVQYLSYQKSAKSGQVPPLHTISSGVFAPPPS